MITVNNIVKKYRTDEVETTALNKVTLSVNKEDFIAVMGPSGCGKSTLLNVLGLIDTYDEGEYKFLGKTTSNLNERGRTALRKGNIGFVFQNFNLIDEINVFENIELPLLYLKITKKERTALVEKIMERMDIAHRSKHFPQQLSGGQQQRVSIARAVVANPQLILADEPTGNLDSKNSQDVMNVLKGLNNSGTSIVMVTHSHEDAKYAKNIVNLFDGMIVD
ncbi:MAG: ABC transporter ATP-binding protein [Bacteroidetes bacterium]|nr:ABC transporter ATP-binding protein [Bacteroidota bacterium]MBL7110230.1 ABC transporter ATP-binding protein [Candidatus Neomarinimicrobiota bacterium]